MTKNTVRSFLTHAVHQRVKIKSAEDVASENFSVPNISLTYPFHVHNRVSTAAECHQFDVFLHFWVNMS